MLNVLHTFQPSPVAFSIGPFGVHWYGVLLVVGILAGYWLVGRLAPRRGFSSDLVGTLYVNALIGGFIGARLYHVISDWGFYGQNLGQIIAVWNGGLAIHGGILGAVLVVAYYVKKHHLNFWKLADLFALAAILGQAIGRWGNYFNQELFGRPTDTSWGIPINPINRPAGYEQYEYFHPTFLYESIVNFIIFGVLLVIFRKQERPVGLIFWIYLGLYSLGRAVLELFKTNPAAYVFGLRVPLVVSIVLAVASLAVVLKSLAAKHKP